MTFNKILSLVLCVLMCFSLVSCQKNGNTEFSETTYTTVTQQNTDLSITSSPTSAKDPEAVAENTSPSAAEKKIPTGSAEWNKSQIIEFYKSAASASDKTVVSEQSVTLQEFTINGGGYERFFEIITPAMTRFLSDLSSPKNGITGEFYSLSEADVKSAKAYTVGDKTAVELLLYDQVPDTESDTKNNSVGHAVTTVSDISTVINGIKRLRIPLEISEETVKINYTKASVRVLIDNEGKIVNGTWGYRAIINLYDYSAFGLPIESTRVVLDNIITVNGGFS